jgi:hypothetical protein
MMVQANPHIIFSPLIVIEAEIFMEVTISEIIIWVVTLEAEKMMSDRFILMGPKDQGPNISQNLPPENKVHAGGWWMGSSSSATAPSVLHNTTTASQQKHVEFFPK